MSNYKWSKLIDTDVKTLVWIIVLSVLLTLIIKYVQP